MRGAGVGAPAQLCSALITSNERTDKAVPQTCANPVTGFIAKPLSKSQGTLAFLRFRSKTRRQQDAGVESADLLNQPAVNQSVERRNSEVFSDFAGSGLTGSILALSTGGVSTRADTSAERVCSRGLSERGRATARAINICAAP
jgi:hypothetical protein